MALRGISRALARNYSLQEFHAKKLLGKYGATIQRGAVALSPPDALKAAQGLKSPYIVKANVPVGGRGLGRLSGGLQGGVQFCNTPEEVEHFAAQMLGHRLITKQTTSEGLEVRSVLVNEGIEIKKQLYFAVVLDPLTGGPLLIYSAKGGVDIETMAAEDPERLSYFSVDRHQGLRLEDSQKIVGEMGVPTEAAAQAAQDVLRLYALFTATDCLQVEINPWAVTPSNQVFCVDSKVIVDDSALFRQQQIQQYKRENTAEFTGNVNERRAEDIGVNYIELDGDIACLVNGAGLAMATMDIIKIKGGGPANFLDMGGAATSEQIRDCIELLLNYQGLKAIFINVFAGILRCDVIAQHLVDTAQRVGLPCSVVVRFQGTKSEEGNEIIKQGKLSRLVAESDMEKAAEVAVELAKAN